MLSQKTWKRIRENHLFRILAWHNILRFRKQTEFLRLYPSFALIGVPRGGTTTLFFNLTKHPNIGAPLIKEVPFFTSVEDAGNFVGYRQYFPLAASRLLSPGHVCLAGDGNPKLMYVPGLENRLKLKLPNLKLIVMLRDPIDRAISMHALRVKQGKEDMSFEDAIDREMNLFPDSPPSLWCKEFKDYQLLNRYGYLTMGMYSEFLKPWLNTFSPDSFLIVDSREYYLNPTNIYKQVVSFLELPEWLPSEIPDSNSSKKNRAPVTSKLIDSLRARLKPYNKELFELTGIDFNLF